MFGGEAKNLEHLLFPDCISAEGHQLIQHRLCISQPSLRGYCDRGGRILVEADLLFCRDESEMLGNRQSWDPSQVESLASTQDGWQNLVRLRGGKYENYVSRRFLQSFQQRVKRLLRQHVNLVDDVDFEFPARCEADVIAKLSDLVHAIVARAVDLKNIEADPLGNLPTGVADSARSDRRTVDAVHGFGQNAGRRSLTCAAWTDKEIGVSQTLLLNRILQRPNYVILAGAVIETLGAIFSRKDLVTHTDIVMSRPGSASVSVVATAGPSA